jgi:hypothetical protein
MNMVASESSLGIDVVDMVDVVAANFDSSPPPSSSLPLLALYNVILFHADEPASLLFHLQHTGIVELLNSMAITILCLLKNTMERQLLVMSGYKYSQISHAYYPKNRKRRASSTALQLTAITAITCRSVVCLPHELLHLLAHLARPTSLLPSNNISPPPSTSSLLGR